MDLENLRTFIRRESCTYYVLDSIFGLYIKGSDLDSSRCRRYQKSYKTFKVLKSSYLPKEIERISEISYVLNITQITENLQYY